MTYQLLKGNNLDLLPTLADNSIDAIVTDPPYELGFMGKKWDSSGIAYNVELWKECLRVLKPGGHLLSFGGTRTWHRVAVAIEDAGFEVRDSIAWLYGSGFPKSLDVSKAIDKAAGAEREAVTEVISDIFGDQEVEKKLANPGSTADRLAMGNNWQDNPVETKPATPEAQQWQGWGTALKPAFEPIVVARKPLIGTVAENVLTYGTGGLNIDGSRIGTKDSLYRASSVAAPDNQQMNQGWQRAWKKYPDKVAAANERTKEKSLIADTLGRWPANLILDEYTAELLDEQSGTSNSPKTYVRGVGTLDGERVAYANIGEVAGTESKNYGDTGGASRFFYVAKASKRDRNEGLEELEDTTASDMVDREPDSAGMNSPRAGAGRTSGAKNFHPTVKPTELMRYLIKLVTPPNGTVLDPFTGSGSTGKAAILEGFDFIGIELTEDYWPIIEGRLNHAEATYQANLAEHKEKESETLF